MEFLFKSIIADKEKKKKSNSTTNTLTLLPKRNVDQPIAFARETLCAWAALVVHVACVGESVVDQAFCGQQADNVVYNS